SQRQRLTHLYCVCRIDTLILRNLQLDPETVDARRLPGQDSLSLPTDVLPSPTFQEKNRVPPEDWIGDGLSTEALRPRIRYLQKHRTSVSPFSRGASHASSLALDH